VSPFCELHLPHLHLPKLSSRGCLALNLWNARHQWWFYAYRGVFQTPLLHGLFAPYSRPIATLPTRLRQWLLFYSPSYLANFFSPCSKIFPKRKMSSKLLYIGTGAMRITSGSRQSEITPFSIR